MLFCPSLMTMHAKWRNHALIQGNRTIKSFTEYRMLPLINLPQNAISSAKCCDHWDKIKKISRINHGISYTYFAHFSIFLNSKSGCYQKFWENDVLKNLGKIMKVIHTLQAPNVAWVYGTQCGAWCCDRPGGVQGQSPKSSSYLKIFKTWK